MLRKSLTIVAIAVIAGVSVPAASQGSDWDSFWARYSLDRKRNEAWPQPFLPREQSQVRQPFAMMVSRGWQEQNTLTEYHFDPEKHELNQAGIFKIQSILRNSPTAHQSIFVYAGYDEEANRSRLAVVQSKVAEWVPEESTPAIVMTPHRPYSIPGIQADSINRRFQESMPTPTLRVGTGGSATGGGGGGSGN